MPVYCIKKKNSINQALFLGPEPEEELNIYGRIITNEARRRSISVEVIDAENGYFQLSLGGRVITCRESLSDLTTAVAMSRCDDKVVTRKILSLANLRVPAQNTCEFGVTLAMKDSSGPFDIHLTQHLIQLCSEYEIEFSRDVFLHYRSDAAAALEAGNDIRTALICFALDASHGYERTHIQSLRAVARLVSAYIASPPLFSQDKNVIGSEKRYPLIRVGTEQKPQ